MLIYENERTQNIVSRLVTLAASIRTVSAIFWCLVLGVLVSLWAAFIDRGLWWLGGLVGILLGYGLGIYLGSMLTLLLEWMAQSLVAQGELIARSKKPE